MVDDPQRPPPTIAGDPALDSTIVSAMPKPPRLGRYELLERLGVGGMAEVYLAQQIGAAGFHKKVVVKRILPHLAADAQFVQMFAREAKVAARVSHPNVVQIYELAEEGGELFIAMEHIDGLTLHRLAAAAWEQGRALPTDVVIRTIADAALGLHAAHSLTDEQGRLVHLVHRDVSPDNLMVSKDGVTKVLDFGVAKGDLGGPKTKTGNLRGKIPFMPPEQIMGEVLDGRADLYALGVSAYWMLTGERPYDRQSDWHTMQAILNDPPRPATTHNPGIPQALDELLLRLLQKNRDQRPSSGKEVADLLDDLASPASLGGKKTTVAFLREVLPSTPSRGNPVSELKLALGSGGRLAPKPPPAPTSPTTPGTPHAVPAALPLLVPTLEAAVDPPALPMETAPPVLPTPPPAVDVDRMLIKPVTLPAAPNAISDILAPPPSAGFPLPLIALGLLVVVALVVVVVVGWPKLGAPHPDAGTAAVDAGKALPVDAGLTASPPRLGQGSSVDAGVVVSAPRPAVVVQALHAPTRIRWRAGDVVVGIGSGSLVVPAGTKVLMAEDLRRGSAVEVPINGGEADYGALPTGTVLLVRTDNAKVTLGDDDVSLQRKLKLVAGRYRFKVVKGTRLKETTIDVLAGKEHLLDAGK